MNASFAVARALGVALRRRERQPAIGVGAERASGSASRTAMRGLDLVGERFHADLELEEIEALRRLACASAMSCSGVALPSSHIGATRVRRGLATRSISRVPDARPARSSSAISTAECAPLLPTSARVQHRPQ